MSDTEKPKIQKCGGCFGTGAQVNYSTNGAFNVVDCDDCRGLGYYYIDKQLKHRDPLGRFL